MVGRADGSVAALSLCEQAETDIAQTTATTQARHLTATG